MMNRIKWFAAVLSLLCASLNASAQALRLEAAGALSTLNYGMHYSRFYTDGELRLAASYALPLSKSMYIAPGLVWRRMNAKSEKTLLGADIFPTLRLEYMDVPLNLGVRFNLSRLIKLSIEAGPYISYNSLGKLRSGDLLSSIWEGVNGPLEKRFHWGVGASTALELWVLYVRLGFDKSLREHVKENTPVRTNQVFYLGLGLKI